EQHRVQARMIEMGVDIRCNQSLASLFATGAMSNCVFTGQETEIACNSAVLVTERHRNTDLFDTLGGQGLQTLELIGDAAAPGLIVDAVFGGHRAARDFERSKSEADKAWFRREIVDLREEAL
ncbi:MAG: NADH:flavin oxidoreductase, partial [Boseongicola sp.]